MKRLLVLVCVLCAGSSAGGAELLLDGDFDAFGVTTLPDVGASAGAWGFDGVGPEGAPSDIVIDTRPGETDDYALHLTSRSSSSYYVHQTFAPYEDAANKFIVYHERYVETPGALGGVLTVGTGGLTAISSNAVTLAFGNADDQTHIKYYCGGYTDLAPFDAGNWYQIRAAIDLEAGRVDYYLRSETDSRYSRWTQVGFQRGFSGGGTVTEVLNTMAVGQFRRDIDDAVYFDNVSAIGGPLEDSSAIYANAFENGYTAGQTAVGQDGWKIYDASPAQPQDVTIVDSGAARGKYLEISSAAPGMSGIYQDLDAVADTGTIEFSVDLMPSGYETSGNNVALFYLGDSKVAEWTNPEDGTTTKGWNNAGPVFGFEYTPEGLQLRAMNGDGSGASTGWFYDDCGLANDQWFTFEGTVRLTGENRNTWDLRVYDEGGTLLHESTDLGFRLDNTDITRFAAFLWNQGDESVGVDNISLHTPDGGGPEPLAGDLDGDGFVGSSDLDIIRSNWGTAVTAGSLLDGDPSGDGQVGSADLDIVRGNWGLSSPAAVPEPAEIVLLFVAAVAFVLRRR